MKKTATKTSELASMPTRAMRFDTSQYSSLSTTSPARGGHVSLGELYRPTLVAVEEGRAKNNHDDDAHAAVRLALTSRLGGSVGRPAMWRSVFVVRPWGEANRAENVRNRSNATMPEEGAVSPNLTDRTIPR
jgi:hypothetical protein